MVTTSRVGLVGLSLLASAQATKYGYNHVVVRRDTDAIAANFQDIEGVDLLSPAFLNPETIPAGFSDGTKGPTDDDVLGKKDKKVSKKLTADRSKTPLSRTLPTRTTG